MEMRLLDADRAPLFMKNIVGRKDGQTKASKEDIHGAMHEIVGGFEFIVSIADRLRIPFTNTVKKHGNFEVQFLHLIPTCVRKMLISFDFRDYDTALRLSESIYTFVRTLSMFRW